MGIETAVIGGAALAGGLASSKGSKQTSTASSEPWAVQQPYLKQGFQAAQDIYNSSKGTPWYQGDLYTGLNGTQKTGVDMMTGWSQGTGSQLANGAATAALTGMNNAGTFGSNAANFAAGNYGVTSGADPSLVGGLTGFANGALGQAGSFQDNLSRYMTGAQGDPTQANIDAATAYANNPTVQAQIDAAAADVNHTLGTNLVGLNNEASAGGNLNSSRAGAAEAALRGEAGRTIGNISATMRGNAYSQGLQLAEAARGTNLSAQATGLGTQGNYIGQGLGVGQGLVDYGEGQRQFDINSRLQGNAQLGQSAQLGFQGAETAQSIGTNNATNVLGAGQVLQDDANARNAANYQQWAGNDQRASDLLNRYWGIVGGQNWGGTSTSTTSTPGNFFQGALGGASMGMGALGSWGNYKKAIG